VLEPGLKYGLNDTSKIDFISLGLALVLGTAGFGVLVYLTALKLDGHAIGQRPLLFLGVLLVVVGLQFFSLGLISEMITSHHAERARGRDQAELHVDEILS